LFPEMFPGLLGQSLAGKALKEGVWQLETVDIRGFARDKHASVDDTPAGGGPGMVLKPDVVSRAIDQNWNGDDQRPLIYLSPKGEVLTQHLVREIADGPGPVLICGRYEGIDERVLKARPIREVSIGDFVLSGGEAAAMVLIDAAVRLLPGVVGDERSLGEESFEQGLLEYPHYTRPQTWEGLDIPEVLLSGHHGKIEAWRQEQAEAVTKARRPDLWQRFRANSNKRREKDD
jgi:tRNA (guanine37-N1)-methyltransferase